MIYVDRPHELELLVVRIVSLATAGITALIAFGCASTHNQVSPGAANGIGAERSSRSEYHLDALGEGPEGDEAAMRESRKATLPASEIAGPISRANRQGNNPDGGRSVDGASLPAPAVSFVTAGKDRQLFPHKRKPRPAAEVFGSCSASTDVEPKATDLHSPGLRDGIPLQSGSGAAASCAPEERTGQTAGRAGEASRLEVARSYLAVASDGAEAGRGAAVTRRKDVELTTLLRALVAEATWLERDHRAILHVLGRRAERANLSIDEMARRYVSAFKRPPERTWVLELEPACEQPSSWPDSLDWETWRPQCELTVDRIEAYLAGDSIDPCKGRAMHFGARNLAPDIANVASAGWRVVNCGDTASGFYTERRGVVSAQEASGR